ncbi:MAG: hypothetical protein OWQ57_04985, partial [Sulfobacillus sp.]|nr:hypothetical protein [Sulfobacillus sp.]
MGSGTRRVLLYGHDSYGLGHLRRNLRIARSLRDQLGDAGQVFVLSGSPVLSRAHPPHGVTIIPLPPVVKTGPDLYASRVPGMSYESVIEKRAAI